MPLTSCGARLKGRARGALICAVSGSAWMFWAAAFAPTARNASLVLVTVMTVLIGVPAVMHVRTARRYADSVADRERWASIAPLFWIDTAAEWVLAAGAVIALARFRRYSLIPQFLGVIIGLHFLPLASLLRHGYNFVHARFGSDSRGRDSQRNSVRRDWSPDVGHRRGDLVPRLKLPLSRLSNDEKARPKPCTSRLGMQPAPRVFSSNAHADIFVEQRIRALPVVTRATGKNTEPDHRPNLPLFAPSDQGSFKPPGADRVPDSRLRNDRRLVLVQGTGPDIGSLSHQETLRCPLLAGQAPRKQDTFVDR